MRDFRNFGLKYPHARVEHRKTVQEYLKFKLATHGYSYPDVGEEGILAIARGMVRNFQEKNHLLEAL